MTHPIFLYLAFILIKEAKGQCSAFFPHGSGQVYQVQSGNDLQSSLNQFGNGDVIQLNVINGTKWVGLGGNVETFEAVIGRPPMTSSDITLKQALSRINQTSIKKGLISFDPQSYSTDYEELLTHFSKCVSILTFGPFCQDLNIQPVTSDDECTSLCSPNHLQ